MAFYKLTFAIVNEARSRSSEGTYRLGGSVNKATNGFPRVVEYKGCAIDPVSTAGSWAPRWTREGKRYDRLPAFATRTKAIEQTKRIIDAETWQRYCEYNVAHDMEHANTRKKFNEWCADRDKEDWK